MQATSPQVACSANVVVGELGGRIICGAHTATGSCLHAQISCHTGTWLKQACFCFAWLSQPVRHLTGAGAMHTMFMCPFSFFLCLRLRTLLLSPAPPPSRSTPAFPAPDACCGLGLGLVCCVAGVGGRSYCVLGRAVLYYPGCFLVFLGWGGGLLSTWAGSPPLLPWVVELACSSTNVNITTKPLQYWLLRFTDMETVVVKGNPFSSHCHKWLGC